MTALEEFTVATVAGELRDRADDFERDDLPADAASLRRLADVLELSVAKSRESRA